MVGIGLAVVLGGLEASIACSPSPLTEERDRWIDYSNRWYSYQDIVAAVGVEEIVGEEEERAVLQRALYHDEGD
jgi:hypothetical protein